MSVTASGEILIVFAAIGVAHTGLFLNVTPAEADRALGRITNQRLDLVGPNNAHASTTSPTRCVVYLNAGHSGPGVASAQHALGTNGSLGTGAFSGPGFGILNLGLSRTFRFPERQSIEIRGEASKLLNDFNPGNPAVTFVASKFGQILATAGGAAAWTSFRPATRASCSSDSIIFSEENSYA